MNQLKRKTNVRYQRRRRVIKRQYKLKKITRKQYKKKLVKIQVMVAPKRKISKTVFKRKVTQLRAAYVKKRISRKFYLRQVRTWRSWITISRSYYWVVYRRYQLKLKNKKISTKQFKFYTRKLRKRRAPRVRSTQRFYKRRVIRMRRLVK